MGALFGRPSPSGTCPLSRLTLVVRVRKVNALVVIIRRLVDQPFDPEVLAGTTSGRAASSHISAPARTRVGKEGGTIGVCTPSPESSGSSPTSITTQVATINNFAASGALLALTGAAPHGELSLHVSILLTPEPRDRRRQPVLEDLRTLGWWGAETPNSSR
eukprot:COSAG06_NODE_3026_length_5944_cov_8.772113_5_plen_161_part_00